MVSPSPFFVGSDSVSVEHSQGDSVVPELYVIREAAKVKRIAIQTKRDYLVAGDNGQHRADAARHEQTRRRLLKRLERVTAQRDAALERDRMCRECREEVKRDIRKAEREYKILAFFAGVVRDTIFAHLSQRDRERYIRYGQQFRLDARAGHELDCIDLKLAARLYAATVSGRDDDVDTICTEISEHYSSAEFKAELYRKLENVDSEESKNPS